MKKILLTMACAGAITVSAFAQLLDEKNVTITMDLQPILQLSLQGPDQIDFTFDEINEYYAGITKYGANILRVSSSVSFDLWAVGLSQNSSNFLWDNVVDYQTTGSSTVSIDEIPITALELRQFPSNPSANTTNTCDAVTMDSDDDYRSAFAPYSITSNNISGGNNCIFTTSNSTPYTAPVQGGAGSQEKYIAGGDGTNSGCSVAGGSYLLETLAGGVPSSSGYFFVMDYRILPGLPAKFPSSNVANQNNSSAPGNSNADNATSLDDVASSYAAPGVYTMFVKYILVEDQ